MEDILKASFADLPDELTLPSGTWQGTVRSVTRKTSRKGDDYTLIALAPETACADVDPDALEEWNEDGDPDTAVFYRVRGSVRAQGAQLKRLGQLLKAENAEGLVGKVCRFVVSYDPNLENPDRPWQRVGNLAAPSDTDV